MSTLGTAAFWISTLERAFKTFAQALAAAFGAVGLGIMDAPWQGALSLGGMAALLSVLSSVVSAPIGPDGSPSLVGEPPAVDGDPPAPYVFDDE